METVSTLRKQELMFAYATFVRRQKRPKSHYRFHPGTDLRNYLNQLGQDRRSQFHKNVQTFIECTKSSEERDSAVILTNIRQFMNGMKNFLQESGGNRFKQLVDNAKRKDRLMVFDLDAILESIVYDFVVEPLFDFLIEALSNDYYNNVVDMIENSKDIAKLTLHDLGLEVEQFSPDVMIVVRFYLKKMQAARNPIDKLDYFLNAITIVVKSAVSCETGDPAPIYTDQLVPLLVWLLVHCGVMTAEMELIFIQRLVHPVFVAGESNFYIKSLGHAVDVIKHPQHLLDNYKTRPKHVWRLGSSYLDASKELKVLVPDPTSGVPHSATLIRHRPDVTALTVCATMARKLRMPNPELCSLYKLVNGQATILESDAKVLDILKEEYDKGNLCYFVYMYEHGQITWPLNTKPL
ncbi:hypothetical protein LSTR_LSTR011723 [Laodelphax striatellus]|uniref:VPS9 domain-containing protein n=1 Tax=Laodelphax striatellus TaxID=195883 RepID=A0A482WQY4_LAOST|nr:hypothetical protein LSTR_LSTR011723 [Laodelphax striatellus]